MTVISSHWLSRADIPRAYSGSGGDRLVIRVELKMKKVRTNIILVKPLHCKDYSTVLIYNERLFP